MTRVFLISGTSWTVPSDWNSANNSIETIGAGGLGGKDGRGGGGGGAYSKITNLSLTPGNSVTYQTGITSASWISNNSQLATKNTYFNGASLAGSSVGDRKSTRLNSSH